MSVFLQDLHFYADSLPSSGYFKDEFYIKYEDDVASFLTGVRVGPWMLLKKKKTKIYSKKEANLNKYP